MGQLVFYVKHLSARQSWAAHLSEDVTALWLVREGEKNKLIIVRLGSCQGKKAFFVIYLLVFIHTMINLQLARRSGSDSSCARENNLFHMMSTWGGLVSNYFLQLLSNSRTEKSREGTRMEDKGKGGEGEMPQSQGSRTAVWNRQMRAAPGSEVPRGMSTPGDPSTWAGGPSTLPAPLLSPGSFLTRDTKEHSVQQ